MSSESRIDHAFAVELYLNRYVLREHPIAIGATQPTIILISILRSTTRPVVQAEDPKIRAWTMSTTTSQLCRCDQTVGKRKLPIHEGPILL